MKRRVFLQSIAAAWAETEKLPPVRAITHGPKFHWFGYYDKLEFDPWDGGPPRGRPLDRTWREPRLELAGLYAPVAARLDCTYLPGNRWILNDTYPDKQRLQHTTRRLASGIRWGTSTRRRSMRGSGGATTIRDSAPMDARS